MTVLQSTGHTPSGGGPDVGVRRRMLAGISLGYFMVLLDMTVLSVAEPDLAVSLHASVAGLQWATTGYTVTFAALLLSAGAASDRYGAHRLFRSGTAVFSAASLLCAAAPALWVLVVMRAVMGVAAAACVPASMSLIAQLYPEPAARARAIATWASTSGAAVAAGPIAGGALVGAAGWRAVFLINVPIGVLVLALIAHRGRRGRAVTRRSSRDASGAVPMPPVTRGFSRDASSAVPMPPAAPRSSRDASDVVAKQPAVAEQTGVPEHSVGVGLQAAGAGLQPVGVGLQAAGAGLQLVGVGLQAAGAGLEAAGAVPGRPNEAAGQPPVRRIDWPVQLVAAIMLALVTDAVIAAGGGRWTHAVIAAAGALASLAVFARLERRSSAPALNRELLRVGRVRAALLVGAAVNFALSGALFVLPLVLQRHLDPLWTGLAFLPLTVPFAANPPVTGRIVARVGPHGPILAGLTLMAAGGGVLAAALFAGGGYPWMALGLLLTGFGVSFALPALTTAIVGAAPPGTTGGAAGVLNAVRQTGAAVGVAAMGAVIASGAAWSLVMSSSVCAAALTVFALAGRPARASAVQSRRSHG